MDIQAASQAVASQNSAKAGETRTKLTSDYEMFLKMLTTQMTNQDPLNPVDSSDYAVQLATFSSVEQQVLTNELLSDLTARFNSAGLSDLGNWIGREVKSDAPAYFSGQPITIAPTSRPDADTSKLIVRDQNGANVQELALGANPGLLEWAGVSADGSPLPFGQYTFHVAHFQGEELVSEEAIGSYARVMEARTEADGTQLVLPGNVLVSPDSITAIRS
ncbi:flagellar hook capping FlgD N-terminal domain-containing protein [Primorskyibacter sp. S187A]|uniref:flagellar hook capping FlgD N-terminal domain-containing protein n=1 Tax=Primorskyibacter sp. S187A TaxID=3415130 RepID=UPI003C7C41B4